MSVPRVICFPLWPTRRTVLRESALMKPKRQKARANIYLRSKPVSKVFLGFIVAIVGCFLFDRQRGNIMEAGFRMVSIDH